MRKFLFKILIFGILLLIQAFIAEFVVTGILRKSKMRMLIGWNEIYSSNLQIDVIIMGSSRAWVQYNPYILDSILGINFYNLGIDGSAINRQILKYNTYRRWNLALPKVIIQNIDASTMQTSSGYEREQFFPYFFDDSLRTIISEYEKFNIFDKYLPLYRYIGNLSLINKRSKENYTLLKGYCGIDALYDGSSLAKQVKIPYDQDSTALALFDEYLSKAYSEGIKVIFVYAPYYIEATKKIENIEQMYKMYDSIAKKYDIPILDYNYDSISYDTAYFYNAMHLNKTGAELFSAKLAHAIDSMGIN
jgi:hypothetical protein